MRILVLCTGNTCRSQMAGAFLKSMYPEWEVYTAGTRPGLRINPLTVEVMRENGIDLSGESPSDVRQYLHMPFDVVLTVCSDAEKECPVFAGEVRLRLHQPFDDPAACKGDAETCLSVYRRVRDEIEEFVRNLPSLIGMKPENF